MNLILMGSPGVGKGTQSRRLARLLRVPCISSGDMFREIRRQNTDLAREVRGVMDRGAYVPDELTIRMVLHRLDQSDARNGFILDGFPRTVPQARALDDALGQTGRQIDHVIVLEAPEDVVLHRLEGRRTCERCGRVFNDSSLPPMHIGVCDECGGHLEQRADEAPETQRYRLKVYADQTKPVLAYYQSTGRLQVADAEPSPDRVTDELMELLDGVAPA